MSDDTPRIAQRATDTFTTAVEAYLWGYPLVLMDRTRRLLTHRDHRGSAPVNTLRHRARLAAPRDREIVKPNNDTLYSIAWLDLARGPLLLEVPDVDGRYYSFQFLDAYTNTWAYVGSRTTGTQAGRHLIVGPGSNGSNDEGPDGAAVLRSPTDTVWLIGRTLVDGEEDVSAASKVMRQYRLTPLRPEDRVDETAAWSTGPVPSPHTIGTAGIAFFDELGRALEADPPPASDSALLKRFAGVGIGPGLRPAQDAPDGVTRLALEQAVTFGAALLEARDSVRGRDSVRSRDSVRGREQADRTGTGWSYDLDIGAYGQNHLLRAIVARHGLGALTAEEAVYATTRRDAAARPLTGEHTYRLHFPADRLPPVSAFWSLTAYDEENFLVDNKLDRYALGDRTPGLRYGPDGSLDLYVQHEAPAEGTANWLPVPPGPFELTLRFYEPRAEMLRGEYVLPPVHRQ
ncbi:DUF1254 domain-containing protein [Streptomyces sp. LHD-70]|uniref:DUF1254 domain-containing protein n=1 Tax=Streptomyces sp. LHD-70 TaxID=3072140 RepID=UPI00280DE2B4|nr:DUF1254 domain-containing protein [Streptomyces sp. LHD-70]MDQ8703587.1 DUF1254 domain-containing protein [Streptomyces sp. LHD-70]